MNNGKIGIVLQARMGSKRLPGKIMKKIGHKTMLEHIFFRLSFLKHKVEVILATSDALRDDIVGDYCISRKITCFRGSEQNVLERYYLCAKEHNLCHIIRLTADNPFIGIEDLDKLIDLHQKRQADYTSSIDFLPQGAGSEIFTFSALEKSYLKADAPDHFEHVNEYILQNPALFEMAVLKGLRNNDKARVRLTVDTERDYQRACYIVNSAHNEPVTVEEAVNLAEIFDREKI